jgi:hypothetical protein
MEKEAQVSANEITQYRERLTKQKEFLTDILSKIEKQILALQVNTYTYLCIHNEYVIKLNIFICNFGIESKSKKSIDIGREVTFEKYFAWD